MTANVIDVAALAVTENEDVKAYEAEVTVPPTAPAATYDAVVANEDDMATDAVPNVDPLCIPMNEPVKEPVFTVNVIDVAAEAVVENEELIENDAVVAFDAVPNNEAVTLPEITLIDPDINVSDPVIVALPLNGNMVVATFA